MQKLFQGAQRTTWKTKNIVLFFRRLLSLFPQVEPLDLADMEDNLENPKAYFEMAHYDDSISKDEPTIVLMIESGDIYIDFLHPFRMQRQLNLIEMLLQNCGKMISKRDLTDNDHIERLKILEEEIAIRGL